MTLDSPCRPFRPGGASLKLISTIVLMLALAVSSPALAGRLNTKAAAKLDTITGSTGSVGSGDDVDITNPYLGLNFIISTGE